jgi:hypothetical protein
MPLLLALILSTCFTLILASLPTQYRYSSARTGSRHVQATVFAQVVVLGDIGRSPRMQYHAMSIAKYGKLVDMIGYQGDIGCHKVRSDSIAHNYQILMCILDFVLMKKSKSCHSGLFQGG